MREVGTENKTRCGTAQAAIAVSARFKNFSARTHGGLLLMREFPLQTWKSSMSERYELEARCEAELVTLKATIVGVKNLF